jgi:SARP family transcriptional regulator, regulator of embCAB operon
MIGESVRPPYAYGLVRRPAWVSQPRCVFRCLGAFSVVSAGQAFVVRHSKRASLLAALLLHANEVVSTDRLAEELWEGDVPDQYVRDLQAHVARLRKDLVSWGVPPQCAVLRAAYPGYVLRVPGAEVDIHRFEELATTARTLADRDPSGAREAIVRALALWRDTPFVGLQLGVIGRVAQARAVELRLALIESAVELDLMAGGSAGMVPELTGLVVEYPYRERFHSQLMVALYRAGRQEEALQLYHQHRRRVREDLGVEPGPAMRSTMAAILRHDPALCTGQPAVTG